MSFSFHEPLRSSKDISSNHYLWACRDVEFRSYNLFVFHQRWLGALKHSLCSVRLNSWTAACNLGNCAISHSGANLTSVPPCCSDDVSDGGSAFAVSWLTQQAPLCVSSSISGKWANMSLRGLILEPCALLQHQGHSECTESLISHTRSRCFLLDGSGETRAGLKSASWAQTTTPETHQEPVKSHGNHSRWINGLHRFTLKDTSEFTFFLTIKRHHQWVIVH